MKLARLLARHRFRGGYTQKEYAAKLGVPLSSYTDWEQGMALPSPENYRRILDAHELFSVAREELRAAYASDQLRRKRFAKRRKTLRAASGK